jgi:hypothetical protein
MGPDANAIVRFFDIEKRAWIANAQSFVAHDTKSTDTWIAEGMEWARRPHSDAERGTVAGLSSLPDFATWRTSLGIQAANANAYFVDYLPRNCIRTGPKTGPELVGRAGLEPTTPCVS